MKLTLQRILCTLFLFATLWNPLKAQHSVAREWNEVLLEAIRNDFARPTVHARNLFHISAAMYDAWAVYDEQAKPFFLGRTFREYTFEAPAPVTTSDKLEDQNKAVSYAAYRILKHRFEFSPSSGYVLGLFDSLMTELGYDPDLISTDYHQYNGAGLGNFIAEQVIEFGLQDGSNEQFGYNNLFYLPANGYQSNALDPVYPGNPNIVDPNRWQPLKFGSFIDQSGHQLPTSVPAFLGAEWGQVVPFSLTEEDLNIYTRDNFDYWVYHDPGPPPYIDTTGADPSANYKWTFSLVTIWSSHLDANDGVLWDISPGSIGNNPALPASFDDYPDFYDLENGGDQSRGWDTNPVTGQAYAEQWVPRGDYARVLAEFWADGPSSETPPGHWFTILNYVNDHPLFEKKYRGEGPVLDELEWDVKAYFLLGGTMHDAAITAWGIKGWYDYVRPISALRYMADNGQSSDSTLPNYHPNGIPLVEGLIELIGENDSLVIARDSLELINTIKFKAWKGHYYIDDPDTSVSGVGWIPAGEWWSYQRPTFVTPPFAGYVSGHSTFSRAAAETMTWLTGDPFFPGGMGEFHAPKNEFLVFEDGPSIDMTLQWATYVDASDQTSLSRIWGGIHPPADDINGRLIGIEIAEETTALANKYFSGTAISNERQPVSVNTPDVDLYPNPVQRGIPLKIQLSKLSPDLEIHIYNVLGQKVMSQKLGNQQVFNLNTSSLSAGMYLVRLQGIKLDVTRKFMIIR